MVFLDPHAADRQPVRPPLDGARGALRVAEGRGLSTPLTGPRGYVRGAVLGLPLAAAALWMASVTTTGAPPAPAEPQAAATAEAAHAPWFDLERQRARLEQLAEAPDVGPSRNPFRFAAPPVRPAEPSPVRRVAAGQPALSDSPVAVADPPVPVRLIGIAASPSTDGPRRSAILSGLGQVFIVGAGGLVGDQYRVEAVGEDAVELRDETTGRVVRLGLR